MPVPLLSHLVTRTGIEPVICTLKGYRVTPIPLTRDICKFFYLLLAKRRAYLQEPLAHYRSWSRFLATLTRFELAISCVTGRRIPQISHRAILKILIVELFGSRLKTSSTAFVAHETHVRRMVRTDLCQTVTMAPDFNRHVISCHFRLYVD